MIFRVFEKRHLEKLYAILASENPVIGPVVHDRDKKGRPLYHFGPVDSFDRLALDFTTTKLSAKNYFLPFRETLATFEIKERGWNKNIDYNIERPFVFFGMHACDINALNKLDKVLLHSVYPMPYYAAKRRNMFIIGLDCEPQPYCFCRSMGTDTVLHGFDMFITDIGDHYFAEILTDTAFNFLKKIPGREAREEDHQSFMRRTAERNAKPQAHVDTTDLSKILDMEFQSRAWDYWGGEKCLSCGTCANVCPTCYCYGVEETVDVDLSTARKTKHLYSCNVVDFASVAGGHNFRPESATRLKYRYYHKHRGFVEAFEESLCVGCGRCSEACLAGITVPEVIADVRGESKV